MFLVGDLGVIGGIFLMKGMVSDTSHSRVMCSIVAAWVGTQIVYIASFYDV